MNKLHISFHKAIHSLFYSHTVNVLVFSCLFLLNSVNSFGQETDDVKFDIGLFKVDCSTFEVRIKPDQTIETNITNIQFTLKWPENSFDITDIATDYGLVMQGPVFIADGFKYAVFVTVPAEGIYKNWVTGTEYTVLTFNHNQTGQANIDVIISEDIWTAQHNGMPYIETQGLDKTGVIYHNEAGMTLCPRIDIGLFNTGCSTFEVRIRSNQNIESTLTNIQFTLKWPENSFEITDIATDFGLAMQGPVFIADGFKYAVFVTVPAQGNSKNLEGGVEYTVMTFNHNQTGPGIIDVQISEDTWTQEHNGMPYVELLGLDNSGIIYHNEAGTALCPRIDIGVFNTDCSIFEVRIKPNQNIKSTLTNIQFTLKWPENSFDIINVATDYGLAMQGPVFIADGFKYAVFVTVPVDGIVKSLEGGVEYTIMTFNSNQQGNTNVDIIIPKDAWTEQHNGLPYIEILGLDNTGIVYHDALNANSDCPVKVFLKVILQGAYDPPTSEMRTALNQAGVLPVSHPYNISPWSYAGLENVTTFSADIVDWILLELRDKTQPEIIIGQRACLLSKNGDVFDIDHTQGVNFEVEAGDYLLVVKHRNHLPVMSAIAVSVPNELHVYDFTPVSTLQQLELVPSGSGKYGMIAGNVLIDNKLIYNNQYNDRAPILSLINTVSGTTNLNAVISGYYDEDTSLDTKVIYNNLNNDRSIILQNLIQLTGSTNLNSVYTSTVP